LTGLNPDPSFGGFPEDAETGEISWRKLVPVSGNLADVIDKMVRKDYRQRYVSAVEVMPVLQTILQQPMSPTIPSPPPGNSQPKGFVPKVKKFIKDTKIIFEYLAATGAVVGLIFGIMAFLNLPKTYEDSKLGVKLKYPDKWQKQVPQGGIYGNGVVFVSPKDGKDDKFQESVSLSVISNQSASTFYENLKKERKDETGETLPKTPQTKTLAKGEANSVVSEGVEDKVKVKREYVWREVNGKLYVLIYAAESGEFSEFLPKFEKIKDSLEIR
jgi:eukaryotic-like serine/threonine-protein kinase